MILAMEKFSVPPTARGASAVSGVATTIEDGDVVESAALVIVGESSPDCDRTLGDPLGVAVVCGWVAAADSMLGDLVDTGTPGTEHVCMPRGLWMNSEMNSVH